MCSHLATGLFAGTCVYTGTQRGNYAKCNTPLNSHNWKLPSQFNPGFVCGKRRPVRVALGALSEFKGGVYEFELRHVSDIPCNITREGGKSLVISGSSLVVLEGKGVQSLVIPLFAGE